MKNLFKYLIIATLLISFNSCSTDDDGNDGNTTLTFLEKHEGSVWFFLNNDDYYDYYMRLINNLDTPIEAWDIYNDDDCYDYERVSFTDIGYDITENSENKFELIMFNPDDETNFFTVTLTTPDNTTLEMKFTLFENGVETLSFIDNFVMSWVDVDALIICDD